MANNKNQITSFPLNSKLNMTSNAERVDPKVNQFNCINSPVYGGNITPQQYVTCGPYSFERKFAKDGSNYSFRNGRLYRNEAELKDFSSRPYVENIVDVYTPNEWDSDQQILDMQLLYVENGYDNVQRIAEMYTTVGGNTVTLRTFNVNTTTGSKTITSNKTLSLDNGYTPVSGRIILTPRTSSGLTNWLMFLVVAKGKTDYRIYATAPAQEPGYISSWRTNFTFNFAQYKDNDEWVTDNSYNTSTSWLGMFWSNQGTATISSELAPPQYTPFIIVSAPLQGVYRNIDSTTNVTNITGVTSDYNYYGITILARKLQGENVYDNLLFYNFLLNEDGVVPTVTFENTYSGSARGFFIAPTTCAEVSAVARVVATGGPTSLNYTICNQCVCLPNCEASAIFHEGTTQVYFTSPRCSDNSLEGCYYPFVGDVSGFTFTCSRSGNTVNWMRLYGTQLCACCTCADKYRWDRAHVGGLDYDMTQCNVWYVHLTQDLVPTMTVNQNGYMRIVHNGYNCRGVDSCPNRGVNITIDSMDPWNAYAYAGIQSTTTIPTTIDGWRNLKNLSCTSPRPAMYNSQGAAQHPITQYSWSSSNRRYDACRESCFRILYNYRQGYVSGISIVESNEELGTIVVPWDSVDQEFRITATYDNRLLYKDTSGNIRLISLGFIQRTDSDVGHFDIVEDNYVVVWVHGPDNVYNIKTGEWGWWGVDWNNRMFAGFQIYKGTYDSTLWNSAPVAARDAINLVQNKPCDMKQIGRELFATGTMGSGIGVAYRTTKDFAPGRMFAYQSYNQILFGFETAFGAKDPSWGRYSVDYYRATSSSVPSYRNSFATEEGVQFGHVESVISYIENKGQLVGTSYPTTSSASAYYNLPIANVEFISSFNGRFGVMVDGKAYQIVYNNLQPEALYNTTSMLDDVEDFFIVQSQYYAVVNNYISTITYNSNGSISSTDPIVDVTGMKFIGAFPSAAYFWSPALQSIFVFTGDADLQLFVQATKIRYIYDHMYAPNNEWIYLITNAGLLVLTQQNVFMLGDVTHTDNEVESSDITLWPIDNSYNVVAYKYENQYYYTNWFVHPTSSNSNTKVEPVVIETEYVGPGDFKTSVIDCWYIRLFTQGSLSNTSNGDKYIKLKATTLTNEVKETDEKTIQITPDMIDDEGCVFIRYQPKYQLGQGMKLRIETNQAVSAIAVSQQGDGTAMNAPKAMI